MLFSNKKFTFLILLIGIFVFVRPSLAATVYGTAESHFAGVGDTTSVEVRIDTEDELINVVEGQIKIDNASIVEVRSLNDAGSAITFWSRKPSLSTDGGMITFVGGTPNGFRQKNALLFKIFFKLKAPGQVHFSPQAIKAYKNDGHATLASVTMSPFLFTVSASGTVKNIDAWQKLVASDSMPPEFLAATDGKDPSMYDNKVYIVITASDYQSGIDHFEVQEGSLPFVRTGSDYVLRDQNRQSRVVINAYDSANNIRTLVILPNNSKSPLVKIIEILLLLLVLVLLILGVWFWQRILKHKVFNIKHNEK